MIGDTELLSLSINELCCTSLSSCAFDFHCNNQFSLTTHKSTISLNISGSCIAFIDLNSKAKTNALFVPMYIEIYIYTFDSEYMQTLVMTF
jgi:hypothetical protein